MTLPLFPSHPTCTACALHTHCGTSGHPGVPTLHLPSSLPPSPSTPVVFFLGQNPGYFENLRNEPFVGKSGRTVRQSIVPGLSLHLHASIYLSNTARCYTPDASPPTNKQYAHCLSLHLPPDLRTILSLHPSKLALVALGAPAARHLLRFLTGRAPSQKSAFSLNGTSLPLPPSVVAAPASGGGAAPPTDTRFFSTFHPAACERDRNLIHAIADHMQLVSDFLHDLTPTPSAPTLVPARFPPQESLP